ARAPYRRGSVAPGLSRQGHGEATDLARPRPPDATARRFLEAEEHRLRHDACAAVGMGQPGRASWHAGSHAEDEVAGLVARTCRSVDQCAEDFKSCNAVAVREIF